MLTHPHCKINLGLYVTAKRPDGFHNIETVFLPVTLHDELSIETASRFQFCQEGIPIGGNPEDNLCVKAYRLLQQDFPHMTPVRMKLHKNIPFGAGLGGGSSDAAYALQMVNQLFDLQLSKAELHHYARQLGSDCAFFLERQPMFATERGDRFEKLELDLSGYALLLLKPDETVSTAEAYRNVKPRPAPVCLKEAVRQPLSLWKESIHNQFEESVFPLHPCIVACKEWLYEQGAVYASMSGSGSTVYGLFEKKEQKRFAPLDQLHPHTQRGNTFCAWVDIATDRQL